VQGASHKTQPGCLQHDKCSIQSTAVDVLGSPVLGDAQVCVILLPTRNKAALRLPMVGETHLGRGADGSREHVANRQRY
jgi:hypothetical protein